LDRKRCLEGVKALTVIGDPFTFTGLFAPGGRPENDGLVKTFGANLNHLFLEGSSGQRDIGYTGSEVRYANEGHFPLIKAMDRKHIGYRYALSFLQGKLLPQETPEQFRIKYFLGALRVSPAGGAEPGRFLLQKKQLPADGRLILPAVEIKVSGTGNAKIHNGQWNSRSGVFFFEGHIEREPWKENLRVRISAQGFEPKEFDLPVRAGQVTYATDLTLVRRACETR
jgi:hypothetical protein